MPGDSTPRLRVAVWNAKAGRPENGKRVVRFIRGRSARYRIDVWVLQEVNHYTRHLAGLQGWRLVQFHTHPMMDAQALLVRDGIALEKPGAVRFGRLWWPWGDRVKPPRCATFAVVDGWLRVVSVHLPPRPVRVRLSAYAATVRGLVRFARRRPGHPLMLAGDWNRVRSEPGRFMPAWLARRIGARIVAGRHFDYAMVRDGALAGVRVTTVHRDVGDGGSDHPCVVFTVERENPR